MKRLINFLCLLALGVVLSPIRAQAQAVCEADVQQFCSDVQAGYGALSSCIDSHMSEFTYDCREWLKKTDHALRKIGNACSDDARNFCRDVKPGYGRLKGCLNNNRDKLSTACADALK